MYQTGLISPSPILSQLSIGLLVIVSINVYKGQQKERSRTSFPSPTFICQYYHWLWNRYKKSHTNLYISLSTTTTRVRYTTLKGTSNIQDWLKTIINQYIEDIKQTLGDKPLENISISMNILKVIHLPLPNPKYKEEDNLEVFDIWIH